MSIEDVFNKINKDFGPGTIVKGSDICYERLPRLKTGNLSLDVALGGGWTVNSIHEVYGYESAGKTTILLKMLAHQMEQDPDFRVFWVAAEEFVPDWARTCGVDTDRVYVMNDNGMTTVYDAVIEVVDSREFDAVVIDSMPALVPDEEEEKGMENMQMGLAARTNGKFFRKVTPALKRSMTESERPCTIFIVNQWRDKIGVMYGDPRTTPGGRAKNFAYFTRTEVARTDWLTEGSGDKQKKVGVEIRAKIEKNKTAPPGRTAHMLFYFTNNNAGVAPGNYDVPSDLFNVARTFDVIKQAGAWYNYEDYKWQGSNKVIDDLSYDLSLQEKIRTEVYEIMEMK